MHPNPGAVAQRLMLRVAVLTGFSCLMAALPACSETGRVKPYIISGFQDAHGRLGPHAGVDFAAGAGRPILAAADGVVVRTLLADEYRSGCGTQIIMGHLDFTKFTAYCHLDEMLVSMGDTVKRGQQIGTMGNSGRRRMSVHLHFELSEVSYSHEDGPIPPFSGLVDPMDYIVGCFDPGATYPSDKLVLTHPVQC